jgi:two-component system, chemotaxis family, CheB/CheR fusion protein
MPERGPNVPPPPKMELEPDSPSPSETYATFPIVAVGASAGGIAPFLDLLGSVGDKPGMAFVYILHQQPHEDGLAEVVSRGTAMPVAFASAGLPLEADHVYVAPSRSMLTLSDGHFATSTRGTTRGMPIDLFFHSLAEHHGARAIGVVLSGSDSDGALGTRAIKAEGGITFAQDETAKFPLMPHAAASIGSIDFILPPAQIGAELLRIIRHAYVSGRTPRLPERELNAIFRLLQAVHDIDFTHYKPNTIERRIRRRMALHKLDDVAEYVSILRQDRRELELLCADMLIRVTAFFRDPEVFTVLQREILPRLLADRQDPFRIWVPGCATGEEVYSLAMAVLELAPEGGFACPVQIFGTDVSEAAVQRARLGFYPENIVAEVSAERLERFFTREEGMFRVTKELRDCCIFARQNLTRDPPFSRLDLISCRNVLIYLGAPLQRKVMSVFHYALNPGRFLLLGSSESIGTYGDLFAVVDRRHKIYLKKSAPHRLLVDFDPVTTPASVERLPMQEEMMPASNIFREADRVMLSRFTPPGVLINEQMDVLQFRGRTSLFLEPPSGVASFNVLKMAREGLLAELRSAIQAARKQNAPVRREGLRVKSNGDSTLVDIEVVPFQTSSNERYQIVLFEAKPEPEPGPKGRKKKGAEPEPDTRQSVRLRRELDATREYLQSIIEEQEAMNEELRSANEEVQSSNEELQSTNEELETAKEELQSSNEELITLNEELQNRNEELAQANNDLVNLLASVDLPILMLDSHLRIRRFNPGAQRTLNLIAADIGRSIEDLKTVLDLKNIVQLIGDVVENLEVREQEVQDRNGRHYAMRVRQYKTTDNRIEGAVVVLIDKAG